MGHMDYKDQSSQLTFKSVITGFMYRLSELTAIADPIDYHVDTMWSLLEAYIEDSDHDNWERSTASMDYASSMVKLRIMSLVLYRNGVFPLRQLQNLKYAEEIKKGSRVVDIKKGMVSNILDRVEISIWTFRHMHLLSFLTKKGMDANIHIDAMWCWISPYITEEDYIRWQNNNDTFGNPNSDKYHPYMHFQTKIRICVIVMKRADFLWRTSVVDAPMEYIDDKGEINVRSSLKGK